MIKIIAAAAVMALTITTASAATANEPTITEKCNFLSNVGFAVMTARQNGKPLIESIEATEKLFPGNNLAKRIVFDAYDTPVYSTELYKDRAIGEFADDVALKCFNVLVN